MNRRRPAEIEQHRGTGLRIAIAVIAGWIVLTGAPAVAYWVAS